MAINKVVYGNQTLMDLTADTVTASDVASGVTFHNAAGEAAVGTASGSGDVDDVKVNGTSVVDSNKVAQITSYKEVTQYDYDQLPSSKLSDDVLYMTYEDGTSLDPDYTYVTYGDNDEIIVRIYHSGLLDQEILWFFRGWNQTSGDMIIPTELQPYKPSTTNPIFSANYPNGGTSQNGWIGFYSNYIRAWNQSTSETTTGIMYGVVNIAGGASQTNAYTDPYVYIQNATPTRKIYLNEHEYSDFNNRVKEVTLAEYIALGDVVNTDGKLYCITDLNNSDVQGYPPLIYSDEEREVGVWRDGKPLYQKTFNLSTTFAITSTPQQLITITDIPFDTVLIVNANVYDSDDNRRYDIPNLTQATPDRIFAHMYLNKALNPCTFFINAYSGGTNYAHCTDLNVTIQYTKTTDVAGSGIWNGQGGIAHHYSTEEKVIGTWIDGKPLYEKTIVYDCVNNSNVQTAYSIPSTHFIVTVCDAYFENSANNLSQQARYTWYKDHFWSYIVNNSGHVISIHRETTDGNWQSGVKFVAIIRYTKTTD